MHKIEPDGSTLGGSISRLKPYLAGSDKIRENVSQAENNMTVASGWLAAKLV